ncbi:meiotically up-regulated 190 protein [Ephemerocybe angulata]|uniref:Meiotically up-regulated 190 protein n=1 Tax=Ephemerocybe angulata TaxID=980116 RepID=A0A8H6HG57_9AGAR|nr:meiotically up-regulated 190 protein [Tulosesus angulatus]
MSESSPKQSENQPGVAESGNQRLVTDPVTHQRVQIRDVSKLELEQLPPPPTDKEEKERIAADDGASSDKRHERMDALVQEITHGNWWDDPLGDQRRTRVQTALVAGASAGAGAFGGILCYWSLMGRGSGLTIDLIALVIGCICLSGAVAFASVSFRLIQEDAKTAPDVKDHERKDIRRLLEHNGSSDGPETVAWLNCFLKSLWPIVNPALFVSVADILEDSLQATLPKFIYGVRVADLGQGSEPIRLLGIRWLDAGKAGKEVEGMQAEEGDYINLETSVAFRAKETTGKGLRGRSANLHILMEFYLAGGVVLPAWVELTALLATTRMRISLTPNPPFLSMMTLTLLGKPKVTLKCTPLAKNFLNVMDIPMLSNWIQSSIDSVMEEYVAPRSINLDLKAMLAGRPKMDTDALGVVIITIRKAQGFWEEQPKTFLKNPMAKGADLYITAGWSKWGKPLWSTRIIQKQGSPVWEETTALLVTQTELDALEGLKLQCWDSDRFTADDLHGNVDIPLADVVKDPSTHNRLTQREDGFKTERGDPTKGSLIWEVGYFEKTTLEQHLEKKHQDYNKVKEEIEREAERKLREAMVAGDKEGEVKQQKKEDLKERGDEIIAGSAPTNDWPSGILSVRIEQISGLEIEKIRESGVKEEGEEDETDNMPSAYCTVVINHQRVYKTRTKMKNTNPYFDAGTEKFIRDWKTTSVIIAVRDNRIHENDPLLGIVNLPLRDALKHRSHWIGSLPIVGGVGYGRMRLSLTFRSIQLHLPRRLLGWDVGTLEIVSPITSTIQLPIDYATCHLVLKTDCGKAKVRPQKDGGWAQKKGNPVRLPVRKRYASCLVFEFKKAVMGPDDTPAYATLWLKDIPDDEEVDVSLPVCKNAPKSKLDQAKSNAETDITGDGGPGAHGEEENEVDFGRIEMRLKFWSGLSGYHHYLADKDRHIAGVMEVLDCLEGVERVHGKGPQAFPQEGDLQSDYTSDESDDGEESVASQEQEVEDNREEKEERLGVTREKKGAFKNFRKKQGELHRKHRGLMQWKVARNVAWIGRGVEGTAEKIGDAVTGNLFKHRERELGVEHEV